MGSLWCLLAHAGFRNPSVLTEEFRKVGVPQVGLNETRDIIAHFTGVKDAGDVIDFAVRTQTLLNV